MKDFFFDAAQIFYRKNDFRPQRETLVFIHGLSGSLSAWAAYEQQFGLTYNIVSFDLRGHGKAKKPKNYNQYKIQYFANDLHALIEELAIPHCIVISHSLGSLVALAFITRHPEKITGAVFLAPPFEIARMPSTRFLRPLLLVVIALSPLFPRLRRKSETR
jgi:pimeloyl-ACP methyl ester carboxylesterase